MALRVTDGVPVAWDKRSGRVFRLNGMALEILGAIAHEDQSIADLARLVGRKHREDPGIIRQDVEKFIVTLIEKGIVVEV